MRLNYYFVKKILGDDTHFHERLLVNSIFPEMHRPSCLAHAHAHAHTHTRTHTTVIRYRTSSFAAAERETVYSPKPHRYSNKTIT